MPGTTVKDMDDNLIFDMDNLVTEDGYSEENNIQDNNSQEENSQDNNSQEEIQTDQSETKSGTGSGSDFEIQTETYDSRGETTSSLTDRFGIAVFSDDFQMNEEKLRIQQEEEHEKILRAVMGNPKQDALNGYFKSVMEADVGTVLKTEYDEEETTSPLSVISYGFLGMFLAGTVLFFLEKKRRSKKHENNSYNPEQYHT